MHAELHGAPEAHPHDSRRKFANCSKPVLLAASQASSHFAASLVVLTSPMASGSGLESMTDGESFVVTSVPVSFMVELSSFPASVLGGVVLELEQATIATVKARNAVLMCSLPVGAESVP
jgi:hypothetical protein